MTHQPDVELLLQSLPDPCLILTPDLTVRAANDLFLEATGVSREDLLDHQLFDEVFPDPAPGHDTDGRTRLRASVAGVISTQRSDVARVHRYDVATGSGSKLQRRFWSITTSPMKSADGSVEHLSMTVKDVTGARGLLAATFGGLAATLDGAAPFTDERLETFIRYLADVDDDGRGTAEIIGQAEELAAVVHARTVIEQAKGVLMAKARVTADEAYLMLRHESQHTNVKLREVAARHVALHNASAGVA